MEPRIPASPHRHFPDGNSRRVRPPVCRKICDDQRGNGVSPGVNLVSSFKYQPITMLNIANWRVGFLPAVLRSFLALSPFAMVGIICHQSAWCFFLSSVATDLI